MTREEIKEELLKNEHHQFQITTSATFLALYKFLVIQGIIRQADIETINKYTDEYINRLNEKAVDECMKKIKEWWK